MQAGYVPMKYFFVTLFSARILFNSNVDKGFMFVTEEIEQWSQMPAVNDAVLNSSLLLLVDNPHHPVRIDLNLSVKDCIDYQNQILWNIVNSHVNLKVCRSFFLEIQMSLC